jgi:hypothetical protein
VKRARPNEKQIGLALGAAFAFLAVAILNGAEAAFHGPRWHWWAALGFGVVALLWWFVAVRWKRLVDAG